MTKRQGDIHLDISRTRNVTWIQYIVRCLCLCGRLGPAVVGGGRLSKAETLTDCKPVVHTNREKLMAEQRSSCRYLGHGVITEAVRQRQPAHPNA